MPGKGLAKPAEPTHSCHASAAPSLPPPLPRASRSQCTFAGETRKREDEKGAQSCASGLARVPHRGPSREELRATLGTLATCLTAPPRLEAQTKDLAREDHSPLW